MYGEEYFCPNCNAILNDQPGFDPEDGTWTCTECGMLLMDDETYDGERFEGVAWHCDNCNALLNKQSGFSDSEDYWECEECGHINPISEDEIFDSSEIKRCPNCNVLLNKQYGYYDCLEWTCESCGEKLYRRYYSDDFEEDNRLRCPNCNDVLNEQTGFSDYYNDWTCTECDTKLHRDFSFDEYEVVEEDDYEDTEDYEQDDYEEDDYEEDFEEQKSSISYQQTTDSKSSTAYSRTRKTKIKRRKKIVGLLWMILCIVAAFVIPEYGLIWFLMAVMTPVCMRIIIKIKEWVAVSEGKINAGYYRDFIGKHYGSVHSCLIAIGFSNITLIDLDDSGIFFWKKGKVSNVSIAGTKSFDGSNWFNPDDEVVIAYH